MRTTKAPIAPMKQDAQMMKVLNQNSYVLNKVNMTTWQAVSVLGRGSYAITVRTDGRYCLTPTNGSQTEAQRLEQLINAAVAV